MDVVISLLFLINCLAVICCLGWQSHVTKISVIFLTAFLIAYYFINPEIALNHYIILGLITFLIVAFTFKSIITEMNKLYSALGPMVLIGSFVHSLLLAFPLLIAIFFSLRLTELRDELLVNEIYDTSAMASEFNCREEDLKLFCKEYGLQQDSKDTVDFVFDELNNSLSSRVKDRLGSAENFADAGSEYVMAVLFTGDDPVVLTPTYVKNNYFKPPTCKWYYWSGYKIGKCIKNKIFKAINRAYSKLRNKLQTETRTFLDAQTSYLETTNQNIQTHIDFLLEKHSAEYRARVKNYIDFLFLAILIISLIVYVLIFSGLIKSFLFIWARFLYHKNNGRGLLSANTDHLPKIVSKIITTQGTGMTNEFIQPTNGVDWYAFFGGRVEPQVHGKIKTYKTRQLFFRRLLSGKLIPTFFQNSEDSIGGYSSHDLNFIRIDLEERQEIAIKLRSLLAFSSGIIFQSRFDVKLSSMLKQRLLFSTIRGPGSIILKAEGGSFELIYGTCDKGLHPHQVLAFDYNGGFSVEANNDILSVYLIGHTLIPDDGTLAIRHTPPRVDNGATRFLRRLLFIFTPV